MQMQIVTFCKYAAAIPGTLFDNFSFLEKEKKYCNFPLDTWIDAALCVLYREWELATLYDISLAFTAYW